MKIRGAVFDLDGTLADTIEDLADALNAALAQASLPTSSLGQIRGWVGEGLLNLCRRAMSGGDVGRGEQLTADSVAAVAAATTAQYRLHRLDKTRPYPMIPELLDELVQRRIKLSVLTNKPHEHTEPMIQALFGRISWEAIEGCRNDSLRKPDPRTLLAVLSRMGLAPGEVIMVGDSATDVLTARHAGALAVAVTWGYRDRQSLVDAGPNYLIDYPSQLLQLL